ncbi:hypothetical protein SPACI_049430 [Sporomusa acidovorans DSM 3132]|uniref:Uncharacterized protein n=1 Tax=Sporomusa acidovorans (strain ATCC 49682 / DSM 3132 / Mol) TaxID=1123286 RepID=A0ABZ3JAB9_SPOA4|nr:hypothetical protein SPACI_45890 [Sporomusa acidovorans DSM 3132]SDE31847.1 hypothetical protein SAMN04488499_101191 [Sporomusa acidovorans]
MLLSAKRCRLSLLLFNFEKGVLIAKINVVLA